MLGKELILYLFLLLFFILIFVFLFTRKPILKILVLAFSYNIILFFVIYNISIFNIENSVIDFIILILLTED